MSAAELRPYLYILAAILQLLVIPAVGVILDSRITRKITDHDRDDEAHSKAVITRLKAHNDDIHAHPGLKILEKLEEHIDKLAISVGKLSEVVTLMGERQNNTKHVEIHA